MGMQSIRQIAARHALPRILFASDIAAVLRCTERQAKSDLAGRVFGPTIEVHGRSGVLSEHFDQWLRAQANAAAVEEVSQ